MMNNTIAIFETVRRCRFPVLINTDERESLYTMRLSLLYGDDALPDCAFFVCEIGEVMNGVKFSVP